MTTPSRPLRGRKLLIATLGVATLNLAACKKPLPEPVGNLMPPQPEVIHPPVGNLMAPPPRNLDAGTPDSDAGSVKLGEPR